MALDFQPSFMHILLTYSFSLTLLLACSFHKDLASLKDFPNMEVTEDFQIFKSKLSSLLDVYTLEKLRFGEVIHLKWHASQKLEKL